MVGNYINILFYTKIETKYNSSTLTYLYKYGLILLSNIYESTFVWMEQ